MKTAFYLFCTAFAAVATLSHGAATEIIVESAPGGYNSDWFKPVEGRWLASDSKSKAEGLKSPQAMYNTADAAPGVARFTPDVPVAGQYEVLVTYPDSGNASGVIYKVHSSSGDKEIIQDQNGRTPSSLQPANTWISLGTFQFGAGNSGYVEIRDPQTGKRPFEGEPNGRVYADAVKLVPRGARLPATFENKISAAAGPAAAKITGTPSSPGGLPPLGISGSSASKPAGMPPMPSASDAGAPSSLGALPTLSSASPLPAASASTGVQSPSGAAASSSPAPTGGLPPLAAAAVGSPAAGGLPALDAATVRTPAAAGGTSLGAATPTPSGGNLPPLPSAGGPAVSSGGGLPSLAGAQSTGAPAPGNLPPLGTTVASPALAAAATPALGAAPSLPPLGSSAVAGSLPQSLPPLGASPSATAVPSPPSLSAFSGVGTPADASSAAMGSLPPLSGSPTPASPSGTISALPPMGTLGQLATPAAGGLPATAIPAPDAGNLQWQYDLGAAETTARSINKNLFVFFVAPGNLVAQKYETEYFTNPAVRSALDKFVLVKINFPENTRLAYQLEIYGAGMIAITDSTAGKIKTITAIPKTPDELVPMLDVPSSTAKP